MKKIILSSLLALCAFCLTFGQTGLCDTMYWNHTYSNWRLKIYDSCYTITGTIQYLLPPTNPSDPLLETNDGDYHIYVLPDSQYVWMVDYRDSVYSRLCEGSDSFLYRLVPNGPLCLNTEEICKGAPASDEAVFVDPSCSGFDDTVYLPGIGEYVQVTGPYVYDTVHCWNELHPISKMLLMGATNIPEPEGKSFLDGMKIFPQPANLEMEFEFDHPPYAVTFIKFYNNSGRLVAQYGMAETNLLYINTSIWGAGQYAYSIVTQEQNKVLKSGMISVVH